MEIFYKKDGPHRGPKGVTYGYVSAEKCPGGYFATLPEALDPKPKKEEGFEFEGKTYKTLAAKKAAMTRAEKIELD